MTLLQLYQEIVEKEINVLKVQMKEAKIAVHDFAKYQPHFSGTGI